MKTYRITYKPLSWMDDYPTSIKADSFALDWGCATFYDKKRKWYTLRPVLGMFQNVLMVQEEEAEG